jgi:ParB family chromosome partitioning protein
VRFVGIEAYEAAGGFVMRDLFEEDRGGYLTDPLLLQKLVNEKLEAAAETVRAEGWKWVEAAEDIPYNATYGLRPLVPLAPALTGEEEHELETLLNERDELEASEGDAETENRLSGVTRRITELEANAPAFAPEDVSTAGCFISLDSDGRLCIERGYVRAEDEPQSAVAAEAGEPFESATGGEVENDWRPVPPAAPVEDRDDDSAALPEKLIADLTTFRTLALRDALANDPDTALLALLHTLSLKLLYSYGAHMTCVEIQAHGLLPNTLKDARQTKPAKAIEARTNSWKQALPREARDLWDFLVSLGQEDRRALLAQLVSMTVNAVIEPRNPGSDRIRHADQLAEMLALDLVEAGFTPTAENYFSRVTKAEILNAVTEARGEETASLLADLKKKEMAIEAERLVAGTGWLPAPLRGASPKNHVDEALTSGEPANDSALPAFLATEELAA